MTDQHVTFFSEDRLSTNPSGEVVSPDSDLAGGAWARGLSNLSTARFAARVNRLGSSQGYPVVGHVIALPYYEGGGGLLRKAPAVVISVWGAVRRSSVVAVRLPGVVGLLAVMFAALLRRRLVVELVGDVQEVLSSGVGGRVGSLLAPLVATSTRWAVRRADVVRYVTKSKLQAVYPPGRGAQTFAFSDVLLREEDFDEPRVKPDPAARLIAIGSQEQMYKGHDLLIAATAQLRAAGIDVTLALLGQGRCQRELKALATDLGIAEHVQFMGHLSPRSAVREEIDRSWVFVMPSRTEGLPRALVEAMARGKACVVSDVGGMPELIDPAFVFRSGDVDRLSLILTRLLLDDQLRHVQAERNKNAAAASWRHGISEAARWRCILEDLSGVGH